MTRMLTLLAALLAVPFAASAAPALFPPSVTSDTLRDMPFGVLQADADTYMGRALMLGGEIVGTELTDEGILILVKNLPVAEHPVYGPVETAEVTGEQFAILYPGRIDEEGLWFGNKVLVVAVVQGSKAMTIPDGIPRTQPYLVARCMHIWKTGEYGSYQISDFPHTTDGYYALPQETYCATR